MIQLCLFSDWFSTHLSGFVSFLAAEADRVGVPALHVAPPFLVGGPDELENDQIHLKSVVACRFLTYITSSVSSVLNAAQDVTLIDDDQDMEDEPVAGVSNPGTLDAILRIVKGNSQKLNVVRPLKISFDRLAESTSALETQVRLRRKQDNVIFARIKEESDAEINRSREDRVVITGLERASAVSTSHAEKKAHYSRVITGLIATACPDLDPKPAVLDVFVTLRRDQSKPSVEVRLDSVAGALSFRKAASALAKAKTMEFQALFFSNSATRATSVRVEIMRQIAKKLTTGTESAFVHGFLSRPVLRYEVKEGCQSYCSGTGRSYNFVDSVTRFGDLVMPTDLAPAYKRAGDTFRGAMEQYFILLVEGGCGQADANLEPLGTPSRRGVRGGRRGRVGPRGGTSLGRSGVKRANDFGSPNEPSRKKGLTRTEEKKEDETFN